MKKIVLAVVLSLLMALLTVPTVFAADGSSDYTVEDHGSYVYITKYTGASGTLTIPSEIDGKPVTGLRNYAFNGSRLTSVTIPAGIEYIEGNPFSGVAVTSIAVDPANTHFKSQDGALYSYDMTTLLSYPGGKTDTYVMPASVTQAGRLAFEGCWLESITLSDSVTGINNDWSMFYICPFLSSFSVNPTNTNYECQDGVLYSKDKTVLVAYPPAKTGTSFAVPDFVTAIGSGAFGGCRNLSTITIPSSVSSIGRLAFTNSSLSTLTVPNGVTKIDFCTFYGSRNLTGVNLPEGVTSIGEYSFAFCDKLAGITMPESVAAIGNGAFEGCTELDRALFMGGMPEFGLKVFKDTAAGFKVYYHITHAARWAGYTGYPSQPCCIATIDPQNGAAVYKASAGITDGHISAPEAPVRTGYTFAGWYKEAECANPWDFATDNVTGDIDLFAKWNINSYTVTFNPNYTSAEPTSISAEYDSLISAPIPAPTRTGYTFNGWYTEAACNNAWAFSSGKVPAHDLTLYAKWTIASFTVTFNSQDGSAVPGKTVQYDTAFTAPAPPTKTGYTFGGWYKEPECVNVWNFTSKMPGKDLTLYAKWTPKTYTVAFISQGGSAVASMTAAYNSAITAPSPAPTRLGYDFGGWYKEAACTNPWSFTGMEKPNAVLGGITLYAKWNIRHHDVHFYSVPGSEVAALHGVAYNSLISASLIPSREHYTFKGWYKDAACTQPWYFSKSRTPDSDLALYAKWEAETFKVSFNPQGGSRVAGKTAGYNTLIKAPANPARTGYTFSGWYKEADCLNVWSFSADSVKAATTLYAKWIPKTYTVTFDPKGGTIGGKSSAAVSAAYNSMISIPETPVKAGYIFGGWYKNTSCSTAWNFSAGKVSGNTTLYAKWMTSSYKVTFNALGGTPVPGAQTALWNGLITEPAAPSKAGYFFGGWYTSKTFTDANKWDFKTRTVMSSVTLYARWRNKLDAPTITVADTADDRIIITLSADPYAAWYGVNQYDSAGKFVAQHESVYNVLTLFEDDLIPGETYFFQAYVRHVEDSKSYWSGLTARVPENPGKPGSVLATGSSYNRIHVVWSASGIYRETGYEVWRAASVNGKYTLAGTAGPAASSFDDLNVKTGTMYYYKVRALRQTGSAKAYGTFSDIASARTTLETPVFFATPVQVIGTTSVKVSWNAVNGASGYELWRAPADSGVFKLLKSINNTTGTASYSYTNTGLAAGQSYCYKVRAYRLVGSAKVYSGFTALVIART